MSNGLQGMTGQYNTALPEDKRYEFLEWVRHEINHGQPNPLNFLYNFDVQGYWISGDWERQKLDDRRSDKWKKPNHPTFSNESIYHGVDDFLGGEWGRDEDKITFSPSETNIKFHGENGLYQYFRRNEPGVIIKARKTGTPTTYTHHDKGILDERK